MRAWHYRCFAMEPPVANKKFERKFADVPRELTVNASDIEDADRQFESLTGVNPGRMFGHTPPITVTTTWVRAKSR